MQNPFFNFLRPSLIPELRSDVTAGSSCNIHCILVTISTGRAFPYQLAIILHDLNLSAISAFLAIITFRIQFCIHNVLINKLHNTDDRRNVILHIGNLNIADSSTFG